MICSIWRVSFFWHGSFIKARVVSVCVHLPPIVLHYSSFLRRFLSNTRNISYCIRCKIFGFILAICIAIQHEYVLYSFFACRFRIVMKIFFIVSTGWLIYNMRVKPPVSTTYDRNADNFQYEKWIIGPCVLLALISTEDYTFSEIMWTMSIWLESVAIFPQLVLLQQLREVENLTSNFVFAMGAYRFLYILNWIYRYFVEGYVNWVGWIGGVVQTGLYVDFFYYYAMSKWYGQRLVLPTVA